MTGIVVRRMSPQDVEETLDVFAEVAAEGRWIGTESGFDRAVRAERWLSGLADPAGVSLVVEDAATGRIIGNGMVRVAPYRVAELGMALAFPARGRGIGGRLLDALVEAARGLGAHKIELQVWPHNEPALRLYLSRGFEVEGRLRRHYPRQNGQLWDSIIMGLALTTGSVGEGASVGGTALPDAASLPTTLDLRGEE